MIKLAIIDDDPRLLESLKSQLLQFPEIEKVISSTSGIRFAKKLQSMPVTDLPDVIIMDISMDLADEGILATRKIKEQFPIMDVIMFTNSDKDDLIFEAFKAGAMGYLLKDEKPEFIIKTILEVRSGNAQMSPGIARKTINYFTRDSKALAKAREASEILSVRELEILNLAAKGYTYTYIGDILHIAQSTVKKHMTNIFEKLHVRNKIEALLKTKEYRLPDQIGVDGEH
jgi:DNA-binding NarL/FixJ family response regulator